MEIGPWSVAPSIRIVGASIQGRCKSRWLEIVQEASQLHAMVFYTYVLSVTYDMDLHFLISDDFALRQRIHICVAVAVFVILDCVPCFRYAIIQKQGN